MIKDPQGGEIKELHATYDPASKGGKSPDGRKVKGTLHWVSASKGIKAEVRLYDRLFDDPDPAGKKDGTDFKEFLNPGSLNILQECYVEPSLQDFPRETRFQFERLGYFCYDYDSKADHLVFNRTVSLKDTWAKIENTGNQE